MNKNNRPFIIRMALLMSLVAMAIDTMLPALGDIAKSFKLVDPNDSQLVIATIFFGMSFGLIFYGPLSDAIGRKKPLYLGLAFFIFGSFISMISTKFPMMIIGRLLQGFGVASTRVVSMAIIRDKFSGREMGQIMSLIMVMFVLVPALAPGFGQIILLFGEWRSIFGVFILLGFLALSLIYLKQEETLAVEKRIPFSFVDIKSGVVQTLSNTSSRMYMIASGCIFGAFIGYLSSSQQIFQNHYGVGDKFSFYFGSLALCIGISSYANSKFVMKYGLKKMAMFSLISLSCVSIIFVVLYFILSGDVSITLFMTYLAASFLFMGILFGNLSTLAIEPLGHIAGIANSVISSIQTLISVLIGGFIGSQYNGTVLPVALGFLIMSLTSLCFVTITKSIESSEELAS